MGIDAVIDTNILVQAGDVLSPRQETSLNFLECMRQNEVIVKIDEGYVMGNSNTNSSKLGFEYNKHLPYGSYGSAFLLEIISQERLEFVQRLPPAPINRSISRLPIKPSDRNFVRVAYNTIDKVLVTHDYEDFTKSRRTAIRNSYGINVIDASEFQCSP